MTNPQGGKTALKVDFPIGPGKAIKAFSHKLNDFEKGEILDYRKIWFVGHDADKQKGCPTREHNFGYDNDKKEIAYKKNF